MDIKTFESDNYIDQLLGEYDEINMPLPDIEMEPHLLISKVRKHYMEYVIKLLSQNYETNQKLINKNIYLPSAIWRCAKSIETAAAQACMVVQIYRKNINSVIKELKSDTKKGKLYKNLYNCLNKPPLNEKKTQTVNQKVGGYNCQCPTLKRKRRNRDSLSPIQIENPTPRLQLKENNNILYEQYRIPVAINLHTDPAQPVTVNELPLNFMRPNGPSNNMNLPETPSLKNNLSVESKDSDELMLQLEKLFQGDMNDDDIFESTLCDVLDADNSNDRSKKANEDLENKNQNSIIQNHDAHIKHLDERLVTLAGIFVDSNVATQQKSEKYKHRKQSSKWLCEEYFLKKKLFELLDQISYSSRKNLEKIKQEFLLLFGSDSDDEGVLSPLDETPEFVISCKERIAPWVVKLLTPHYIKGRIRGKALFKAVAKHLIRLIYQCSRYPHEYEVTSFVSDFLENHQMIRCEADFKQFKIANI